MLIRIDDIEIDERLQSRASIDVDVIQEYAAAMLLGDQFPPIDIVFDGMKYWLWSGFHRVFAAKAAGLETFEANVTDGSFADAWWLSLTTNATHGLRRTNADKRRAVERAFKHPNWTSMSDMEIARHCAVSHNFVSVIRRELSLIELKIGASAEFPQINTDTRLVTRGGVTYPMNTRNIGKRPEPEPVLELLELGKPPVIAYGEDDILKRARAIKNERREQQRQARDEAKAIPPDLPDVTERYQLICADIGAVTLEPESIDAIITDPPYAAQYVPLYGALAQLAARVLKPGGSLLAMAGQSYLPEVMAQITPHLRYHWMVSYQTPGGQSPQIWPRRVNSFWKPVLWFVKGEYTGDWVGDVCRSAVNDNDKRFHEWGQSESGLADLLERFTYPGDVVLDPFVGGGTTAVVAVRLGRRFIGVDIDPLAIETTKARLMELAA